MNVSLDASARVVSLLEYRRAKGARQASLPMPDRSTPFRSTSQPSRRQARHRERMLEHLASLAKPISDAR